MKELLVGNAKGLVLAVLLVACFAALFTGRATWEEATGLVKWAIGPWFVAAGIQGAAGVLADAHVTASAAQSTPTPPPS